MTPAELRAQCAKGEFDQPTAGYCPGFVQANLAAVPYDYARDFENFCRNNPQPCPLLEIIGPNSRLTKKLAPGADICEVIPRYLVWKNGIIDKELKSVGTVATEDMVYFLLGCSFSFEEALQEEGISLRHIEQHKNVAMYRTNIPLSPAGIFKGEMVVSMRPIHKNQVEKAARITGLFPNVHGAPVHFGNPSQIGISRIENPDYGEFVEIKDDEIPVFWACGVTPQNVLVKAKLPLAITHAPGYMFISDIKNKDFAVH